MIASLEIQESEQLAPFDHELVKKKKYKKRKRRHNKDEEDEDESDEHT